MKREEEILKFWQEKQIFKKTLEKKSPKGEFLFYEGPPTANGRPGIHHLEARAFKDAIPRYRTMRGYHVRRKAGWDTHGLPVELEVEKALGLKSKKEIEEYGIAKFNEECKKSVWKYLDEWQKFTDRIGYWVDQKDPYIAYENSYIESLWSVMRKINERGLLYKDYKVVPWCPRCGTGLSSHELAQGYEDVKDISLYVKFKVKNPEKIGFSSDVYLIAWTTTPWTLPGNLALAVNPNVTYVIDKWAGEYRIVAKRPTYKHPGLTEKEVLGKELVGLEYEPLYPFIKDENPKGIEKAFKVYAADFVTTEDGTGIVHTAVMYGADDFELGTKIGLPKYHLVGEDGKFIKGTGFLEGRLVTETDVAVDILKDLVERKFYFDKESYSHSYPHCWRCKSKLIYFARDSWYIKMSALRDELVKENQSINWEPAHIRDGRFGEWLREVKDWAISRERYWGTPLPVWHCEKCKKIKVIGSIEELYKGKKSNNSYLIMRHGESENNVLNKSSARKDDPYNLTDKGREQVIRSANSLINKKIDLIISSPFLRAKETAKIVASKIGISEKQIILDDGLSEINTGVFSGKSNNEYHNFFSSLEEKFIKTPENGENVNDLRKRAVKVLLGLENKYKGKTILIIAHEYTDWMLFSGARGASIKESVKMKEERGDDFLKNAEVEELKLLLLPRNKDGELDLHRPYIDEIKLACDCGGEMKRVKEVMDVWFDSGAMPFAQDHYPFDFPKSSIFNFWGNKKLGYPADFICEAIDQTRGWFYTLHAIGVLMEKGKAFKNVICLGHVLDKEGKKMSKSVGNVVDPWEMIDKHGADALRFWMYSVNQAGESKNFDEKTVEESSRRVFGLLSNVYSFYELYRDKSVEIKDRPKSKNILDQWIMARFDELINETTSHMEIYKLLEPTRAIRVFIDDLSTWYLRRSRDRIKDGDKEAKQTLYFVLKNITKLLAPFTPFISEDMYQKLRTNDDRESVHLEDWPKAGKVDKNEINNMLFVRSFATMALMQRASAGIKVRQPLSKLIIGHTGPVPLSKEYIDILKDEINVKEIIFESGGQGGVVLDTKITPELKEEGEFRDLTRAIQEFRKKEKLTPNDVVSFVISTDSRGRELITKFEKQFKKIISAKEVIFEENNGEIISIEGIEIKVSIKK